MAKFQDEKFHAVICQHVVTFLTKYCQYSLNQSPQSVQKLSHFKKQKTSTKKIDQVTLGKFVENFFKLSL